MLEDNPYGLLRYEGEPLPTLYALDGGDFVIYLGHVLEDPLARHPPRLGRRRRAPVLEKIEPRQAGRRPLHLVADAALRRRVLRRGPLGATTSTTLRDALPRAARRDARRARRALPAARPSGRSPRAACSSGRRCPTTSTRPTCSRRRCATTSPSSPGRAAYLDGRGGISMRLNFSGVGRGRRSARASAGSARSSREQVELYGTLTGAAPPRRRAASRRRAADATSPTCCALPRRERDARAPGAMSDASSRSSRAGARSSARSRCAPARGRGRARAARPRGRSAIDVGARPRRAAARGARPTSPSSRCTAAAARTAPCRSCSRSLGIPYTGLAASPACARCMDKVLAKHLLREAGHPDAGLLRLQRDRVQASSAPPTRCRRSRSGSASRSSSSRPRQGSALGHPLRRHAPTTCPARWSPLQLRRPGAARALRRRPRAGGRRCSAARRCRSSRRSRARRTSTTSRRATRSARTDFVCPAELGRRADRARRRSSRSRVYELLGCSRLRARRPDARASDGELQVLEANAIPGLTDTSLLPQAAEAAGIGFDAARRADRWLALARRAVGRRADAA